MTDELTPIRCGCGGESKVVKHEYYMCSPTYGVTCYKCGIATNQGFATEDEAITAWNRAMGAENICENCKEYIFDETYEGWCRCNDEYPTPRKYGCNCFERRGEHD